MKKVELNQVKEVGKKTIADFIRSETGSVGIKNAATVSAIAGALVLSQLIVKLSQRFARMGIFGSSQRSSPVYSNHLPQFVIN